MDTDNNIGGQDDDSLIACDTMIAASEGPRLNTVPGRPYSGSYYKAPDSNSELLRGGMENYCSSILKENSSSNSSSTLTKKNDMVSELRKQVLTSNIRRLKCNIRWH